MPHLILEYSDNVKEKVDPKTLFAQCHEILVEVASADLKRCKSRAIKQQNYYIGDGDPKNAFVHMNILLAEGRSLSTRQEVGKQILAVLENYFARSIKELNLQITVNSKEFPRSLYFTFPPNTV